MGNFEQDAGADWQQGGDENPSEWSKSSRRSGAASDWDSPFSELKSETKDPKLGAFSQTLGSSSSDDQADTPPYGVSDLWDVPTYMPAGVEEKSTLHREMRALIAGDRHGDEDQQKDVDDEKEEQEQDDDEEEEENENDDDEDSETSEAYFGKKERQEFDDDSGEESRTIRRGEKKKKRKKSHKPMSYAIGRQLLKMIKLPSNQCAVVTHFKVCLWLQSGQESFDRWVKGSVGCLEGAESTIYQNSGVWICVQTKTGKLNVVGAAACIVTAPCADGSQSFEEVRSELRRYIKRFSTQTRIPLLVLVQEGSPHWQHWLALRKEKPSFLTKRLSAMHLLPVDMTLSRQSYRPLRKQVTEGFNRLLAGCGQFYERLAAQPVSRVLISSLCNQIADHNKALARLNAYFERPAGFSSSRHLALDLSHITLQDFVAAFNKAMQAFVRQREALFPDLNWPPREFAKAGVGLDASEGLPPPEWNSARSQQAFRQLCNHIMLPYFESTGRPLKDLTQYAQLIISDPIELVSLNHQLERIMSEVPSVGSQIPWNICFHLILSARLSDLFACHPNLPHHIHCVLPSLPRAKVSSSIIPYSPSSSPSSSSSSSSSSPSSPSSTSPSRKKEPRRVLKAHIEPDLKRQRQILAQARQQFHEELHSFDSLLSSYLLEDWKQT